MNERNSIIEDMAEEEMYSLVTHSFTSKKKKEHKISRQHEKKLANNRKKSKKNKPR